MGAIEYDLENLDGRPSRPKRLWYLFMWFLIVFGSPFFSSYFWARCHEHGNNIEALAGALTMLACISPFGLWWFWRGMVYIAFSTKRNLVFRKLALYAISFEYGKHLTPEELEEDLDWYYFYDPNGPNGVNIYDHHDHH